MKYTIKTTYPCVIKTQNEYVELDENDNLECENEDYVYVYPQNTNQIPFCVNLILQQNTKDYVFFNHSKDHFVILKQNTKIEIEQKQIFSHSSKTCKVTVGKQKIVFDGENRVITCQNENLSKTYTAEKVGNFVVVLFKNDAYAYSFEKQKVTHFHGEIQEFENGTLSIVKSFDDNVLRQKTYKVHFGEKMTFEGEMFSSSETSANLLCFNFLEAIKAKDFSFATNLLDDNLKIKKEILPQFFGEISYVLPLNVNEFILLGDKTNYVSLEVKNGKISDIVLDELG